MQCGCAAMMSALLVCIGETNECVFFPGTGQKLKSGGQSISPHEPHWYRNRRKPRRRCEQLIIVSRWCVEIPDRARRIAPGWINQCVQFAVGHQFDDGRTQPLPKFVSAATSGRLTRHVSRRLRGLEPYLDGRMELARLEDLLKRR